MPINYETVAGQLRLLIADVGEGADQLFTDDQINAFLALENQHVKLAAAQALDTAASSEALVSKVIRTQDLSTDGAKTADALRRHAAALRAQVAEAAGAAEDDGFFFDVVDTGVSRPELTQPWYT